MPNERFNVIGKLDGDEYLVEARGKKVRHYKVKQVAPDTLWVTNIGNQEHYTVTGQEANGDVLFNDCDCIAAQTHHNRPCVHQNLANWWVLRGD